MAAEKKKPQAGEKREAILDSRQPAAPTARPHHTRVKILSSLRVLDGQEIVSLLAGTEAEVPNSALADPLLAHCFSDAAEAPAPPSAPPSPDAVDGGSPGSEPPLAANDKPTSAERAGY
ncbi:MAG TPA: hypothetical protein VGH28_13870 [Polyangiaceae bacterium]|jgi:hypothetical protein